MKNLVSINTATIFFLLLLINTVNSGRVLVIAPAPSYSHQIVFRGLNEALLKRGHEVVFVTPIPLRDPSLTNYTEIDASIMYKTLESDDINSVITEYNKHMKLEIDEYVYRLLNVIMKYFYGLPDVQKLYAPDSKQKFDVVIVEGLMSFGIFAMAHLLNAPLIGMISTDLHMYHNYFLGAPILPSHPSNWEFFHRIGPNITFLDRVQNFILAMLTVCHWTHYQTDRTDKLARSLTRPDLPQVYDIAKRTSLLFVDHDMAVGYARPMPPNVILFSGLHITEKPPPLPKDMAKFLDKATEGFIYMSLGCNMKSAALPPSVVKSLYNIFSRLPYKVLWKYESDDLPKNSNIFTSKWVPQQGVLAHPNIKVFIFQGGLQSTEETIHYGVPVLGVPIMFEQTYRVRKLTSLGVGRMLEAKDITEDTFQEAITDVLYNKSYKTNMMNLSRLTKDKPYDNKEHVAWWVEYVMRNKGAPHLRYSGADDPWYQQFDMDVIAFLAIILFIVAVISIIVSYRILRWLYKRYMQQSSMPLSSLRGREKAE